MSVHQVVVSSDLVAAVHEWRQARQAMLDARDSVIMGRRLSDPGAVFERLVEAEHNLMELAKVLRAYPSELVVSA